MEPLRFCASQWTDVFLEYGYGSISPVHHISGSTNKSQVTASTPKGPHSTANKICKNCTGQKIKIVHFGKLFEEEDLVVLRQNQTIFTKYYNLDRTVRRSLDYANLDVGIIGKISITNDKLIRKKATWDILTQENDNLNASQMGNFLYRKKKKNQQITVAVIKCQ